MRIGAVLRAWREKYDLTVREAAPQVGVSIATLSRLERGEQIDAATQLKLIVFLFGSGTSSLSEASPSPHRSEAQKSSPNFSPSSSSENTK